MIIWLVAMFTSNAYNVISRWEGWILEIDDHVNVIYTMKT